MAELKCGFCGKGETPDIVRICGQLHHVPHTTDNKPCTAHQKCMQYSAKLVQYKLDHFGGFDIGKVFDELKRGKRLKCVLCNIKAKKGKGRVKLTAATSGCAVKKCKKSFHFYCAKTNEECVTKRSKLRLTDNTEHILYRVFCSKQHEIEYRQDLPKYIPDMMTGTEEFEKDGDISDNTEGGLNGLLGQMATDESTSDTVENNYVQSVSEFLRKRSLCESAILKIENDKIDHETVCSVDDATLSRYLDQPGDRVALKNLDDDEIIFNFNTPVDTSTLATPPPKPHPQIIIHRGTMGFKELLSAFKDPDILQCEELHIQRILSNGQQELAADAGGVMKDTFTEFWSDFVDVCALGRQVKVPFLRHDFGAEEWKAIGRILQYGFVRMGYWPLQLSKVFLQTCLFPDVQVSSDSLMEDFFGYISEPDRDVFIKSKSNFQDVDLDDLTESLDAHECRTRVTADNISSVLIEIAHKELIQAPMYVCDCWRDVVKNKDFTLSMLNAIYKNMIPTNKSVVEKLQFPERFDSQKNNVCRYLKRYVKELDTNTLRLFLRYCTGSDMLNMESIHVELTSMPNFQRRPISHTCGCLLQLADHYDNFIEFRQEFDGVLQSQIWVMDIV